MKKIIFICLCISHCLFAQQPKDLSKDLPWVEVVPLESREVARFISAIGQLKSKKQFSLFAKAGGKIEEIFVTAGQKVQKDQELCAIDRDEEGYTYKHYIQRADTAGTILSIKIDERQSITKGQELMVFSDERLPIVELHVIESSYADIQVGQKVFIYFPSFHFDVESQIIEKDKIIDPQTLSYKIRCRPQECEKIKNLPFGAIAQAKIITSVQNHAQVIPQEAILFEEGLAYVYQVDSASRALKKEVQVLQMIGAKAQVAGDLDPSMYVVSSGQQNISNGILVAILNSQEDK